jgi:secondary thiamine-phosphate synthase enzyme
VAITSSTAKTDYDHEPAVRGRLTAAPVTPHFYSRQLSLDTDGSCGFHDITDDIAHFVATCELHVGIAVALSLHTTAGLLINEHETGFRYDFRDTANRIAPRCHGYMHDDLDVRFENICPEDREHPNGHAHLQHSLLSSPSVVVPIQDSQLVLGKWQRVFLIEFDRPRPRRVAIHAFGQASSSGSGGE